MLVQEREDGEELLFRELVPERVQKPDCVDLEDGVYSAGVGLKVLEDVLREEIDDVDERVRRRDACLCGMKDESLHPLREESPERAVAHLRCAAASRYRRHEVYCAILCAPTFARGGRIRRVLSETGGDPFADERRGIILKPSSDKRLHDVGCGLASRGRFNGESGEVEPDVLERIIFELLEFMLYSVRSQ